MAAWGGALFRQLVTIIGKNANGIKKVKEVFLEYFRNAIPSGRGDGFRHCFSDAAPQRPGKGYAGLLARSSKSARKEWRDRRSGILPLPS